MATGDKLATLDGLKSAYDSGKGMIAPDYANLTFPVTAGTYCIYGGALYYAKQDIASSEAWTAAHWQAAKVGQEVAELKSAIGTLSNLNTDDKTSTVAAINEVNGHFLDGIAEGVADWLDNHPEATTTVQDGSLTEAKFTDATKLKVLNNYVTPEMFGAKADGTTDDADAFESAMDSGKAVYIPAGVYYLSRPLDNPAKINIFGAGYSLTTIKLADSFLDNNIEDSIICDIGFTYTVYNNDVVVFENSLTRCVVERCTFNHFYAIFNDVKTCTVIRDNKFYGVLSYFCYSIIDSFVFGNYINAPKVTNPQTVCFSNTVAHTTISGNFIDFMYKVFNLAAPANMKTVTVTGNVFDVCYCIFYGMVNGVTFTGNTIANAHKSDNWDVSGNTEMNTTDWCVVKRQYGKAFTYSYLGGNSFLGASGNYRLDMYLVKSSSEAYPTTDVVIDESLPASKFDHRMYKSSNPRDTENVMIRPMLKRTVDSLPSAALTGNTTTFNHDEVIYNGDLYINVNGSWKQLSN